MNIRELEAELEEVMASELKFLPNYGYSPKEEMIEIIQKEIDEAHEREKQKQDYYSDDDVHHYTLWDAGSYNSLGIYKCDNLLYSRNLYCEKISEKWN